MPENAPGISGSGSLITARVAMQLPIVAYSGAAMSPLPGGKDQRSIDPGRSRLIPYLQAQNRDRPKIPDTGWPLIEP